MQDEILKLIVQGLKYKEVGDRLCRSEGCIKTHSNLLCKRWGVKTRWQLAARYSAHLEAMSKIPAGHTSGG